MPCAEAHACPQQREAEMPVDPWDDGASPDPELPGSTGRRACEPRREWCRLHPACALVLAALVALVLALAVALGVQSARGHGENPDQPVAPVLGCPDGWVGYRHVCYYFSSAEGSWEWCRDQCSSLGASLAVPMKEWEMEFLGRLKGKVDYWLGLRRQGERLEWVDGSSFNHTIPVQGQGGCVYLNDYALATSSCSQHRPYLCSKPQAVMGQR